MTTLPPPPRFSPTTCSALSATCLLAAGWWPRPCCAFSQKLPPKLMDGLLHELLFFPSEYHLH